MKAYELEKMSLLRTSLEPTVTEEVPSISDDSISHTASDRSLVLVSCLRLLLPMTREYDLCDWTYLNEPASKNRMRVIFCIIRIINFGVSQSILANS